MATAGLGELILDPSFLRSIRGLVVNEDNQRNNRRDASTRTWSNKFGNSAFKSPTTSKGQKNISNLTTLRSEEEWRKYDEISITVGPGVPTWFNTLHMYNLFMSYGEVETVKLFENGTGVRDGYGRVTFTHVRRPFWEKPFEFDGKILNLSLDKPMRSFEVPSPVNKEILYSEKFKFKPTSLEFGFMNKPNVMISMFTVDLPDITFHVDLDRRLIEITFKVYLTKGDSPQSSYSTDSTSSGENGYEEEEEVNLDRFEDYRFHIPFTDFETLREEVTTGDKLHRVFIIRLPAPPLFWRKVHNVSRTHTLERNVWYARDMWLRQTTIAYDSRLLGTEPIALKQSRPVIDTGRWTTYRFTFDFLPREIPEFDQMISALRDFSIKTEILEDFKVSEKKLPPVWSWIDADPTSPLRGFTRKPPPPALLYPVRYQLEVCISHDCLNEYNITPEFIKRLAELPVPLALALLEDVAEKDMRIFHPMTIFDDLNGIKGSTVGAKIPNYCQVIRKATVTPSMIYFATPTVELTNRVVRHYSEQAERILRVQFMDEKSQRIYATEKMFMNEIFSRIKYVLDNGIKIGDLHFQFLGSGNSQFREHGAYFFAPNDHITAPVIRNWMGDFKEIRIVAKHSARIGQCFSSTRPISNVKIEIRNIEDIERNGSNFTDGVGKLSESLAKLITIRLGLPQDKPPPSCFQFRLGGCKGVLAISPDARGGEVHIRPSQRKFTSNYTVLEVIRLSRYATATLNRQLIIVLSSLGIDDNVFIRKVTNMMKAFRDSMDDSKVALPLLCTSVDHNQFTLALAGMIRSGFMESGEPFFTSLLRLWRSWSIKYLKDKAKIVIEDGVFLFGVVDETGKLNGYFKNAEENADDEETKFSKPIPEIFVQISVPGRPGKYRIIEEICIVARNPSLHPGDIRTVRAVDVPELHHLRDVVVFPQTGDRAIPSMLAGGDLDGDDFIVIWDRDLTYKMLNYPAMDYTAPKPEELSRDVEIDDITKFFVNYMKKDKLGTIANAHLAWADKSQNGVKSDRCIQLASEHSKAVDYVKTGVPAELRRELRVNKYPHFLEKDPEKTYTSTKILGELYDLVEKVDYVPSYETTFDTRILNAYTLDQDMLETVKELKAEYDSAMNRIMSQHKIGSEFEVFSTFVLEHSQATKDFKFHEEIGDISTALKERYQEAVRERFDIYEEEELGPVVAAMYTVTHQELADAREKLYNEKLMSRSQFQDPWALTEEEVKDMPLISFPWLFTDILGKIAKRKKAFKNLAGNSAAAITDTPEVHNGDTELENVHEESRNSDKPGMSRS